MLAQEGKSLNAEISTSLFPKPATPFSSLSPSTTTTHKPFSEIYWNFPVISVETSACSLFTQINLLTPPQNSIYVLCYAYKTFIVSRNSFKRTCITWIHVMYPCYFHNFFAHSLLTVPYQFSSFLVTVLN